MAAKKPLFRTFLAALGFSLASCAVDLGKFEKQDDYESYYDSFGEVKGLYDGGDHSYDIEDSLFNKTTVNDCSWKDDDDAVIEEQYVYVIIPVETELRIETIVLYFYSPYNADVELSLFFFEKEDYAPKNIKYLSSPDTEPVYDSEGNPTGEEKEIEYDDPPIAMASIEGGVRLVREEWTSFMMEGFHQPSYGDDLLHTCEGGLIYLRIENNSGWNRDRLEPVSVSFLNLLIRAI